MLRSESAAFAILLVPAILASSIVLAQPAPPAPAAGESPQDTKAEAAARFYKGKKLSGEGDWSAALAEFQASRKLYPGESATLGTAVCLKQLRRFDEALQLYEVALRDFADGMEPRTKARVQREVVELRGLVGTIEIGQAEAGASITIDGLSRGDFPLLAPLRVMSGSHLVRVYKEGFEPFETRVEVAGGETVQVRARLVQLKQTGTLQLTEARGRALAVVVDGVEVGKTKTAPLSLPLAPGKHVVLLRGEGNLGTVPATVRLRVNEVTELRLEAEALDASLRVAPVPGDALVSIDGVDLGRGAWDGKVRAGKHRIEVAAEGFLAETREVSIGHDGREVVSVALARDSKSPFWRKPPPPPHFVVEMGTGVLIVPSFGGDVAGNCGTGCNAGVGVGSHSVVHGGYQLSSGLGLGVSIGALAATQKTSGRSTSLSIVGNPAASSTAPDVNAVDKGTVDDVLRLRGLVLGAWVGYALDAGLPIHFRLGAGGVFGSMADARRGSFTASKNNAAFTVGTVVENQPARFVFVTPEVLVGWPLGKHVELQAGLLVPVLVAVSRPKWSGATNGIHAGADGYGWFDADALLSGVLVTLVPTIGARFDL